MEGGNLSAREKPNAESAFAVHSARSRIMAEAHARPFVPIDTPRRILHFAFMMDHWSLLKDRAAFEAFCRTRSCPPPAPEAKHHRIDLSPASLRWEHHGEFATYTWEFPTRTAIGEDILDVAFRPGPDELSHLMFLLPQPGPLLVTVDLHILPDSVVDEAIQSVFGPTQLAACEVEGGAARIATDFHPDVYGFVRILISDRNLTPPQAGALVQRVLEIETYRTLALLGLPEAQDLGPSIRRIETELPLLMSEMRESRGIEANNHLLDRLTALAAELEAGAAYSLFRFGATRAYHEIIGQRLVAIGEQPVPGLPSFSAFLARRLSPAIRTCITTEARQETLSRKLSRAAQLLRTRVEIALESQNSDLLRKMNNRARMQLQLQRTVEGLSIAAITYYISAIAHLLFEGAHKPFDWLDPGLATAAIVPLVLVFVTWTVIRIRKKHTDE
jgi:uncharacterized membrane-anchored protein